MNGQGLLIGIAATLVALIVGICFLAICWAGYKAYKLLVGIQSALLSLTDQSEAIASLPAVIEKFSKYTEGHTIAAHRNAVAVEAFSKGVEVFSRNLFNAPSGKGNTFTVPEEADVSKEWELQEILRTNPELTREAAANYVTSMGVE